MGKAAHCERHRPPRLKAKWWIIQGHQVEGLLCIMLFLQQQLPTGIRLLHEGEGTSWYPQIVVLRSEYSIIFANGICRASCWTSLKRNNRSVLVRERWLPEYPVVVSATQPESTAPGPHAQPLVLCSIETGKGFKDLSQWWKLQDSAAVLVPV